MKMKIRVQNYKVEKVYNEVLKQACTSAQISI